MAKQHCPACGGNGRVTGGVICATCGGTGLVDGPDYGPGTPVRGGLSGPGLPPVTGVLRVITFVLVGGTVLLTVMAYQNAQGSPGDKLFTAAIVFGVVGFGVMVLIRTLQYFLQVAALIIVVGVIDHFAYEGAIFRNVLSWIYPAAEQVTSWVKVLIFGPI